MFTIYQKFPEILRFLRGKSSFGKNVFHLFPRIRFIVSRVLANMFAMAALQFLLIDKIFENGEFYRMVENDDIIVFSTISTFKNKSSVQCNRCIVSCFSLEKV